MRLIDADELLKDPLFLLAVDNYGIAEIIEALPTVDAEPVKHAHWIMKPNGYGTCSNCLTCSLDIMGGVDCNYCPNCGAKMDEATQKRVGKALKALEAADETY